MIAFEFPEDEQFFRGLLCDCPEDFAHYEPLFDFRPPAIKRAEFNRRLSQLRDLLVERYGKVCMLHYCTACDIESGINVDHLIPISSNKLNKEFRKLVAEKGKKVKTQSFGSNDIMNLVLACVNCNANKKHRFLTPQQMRNVFHLKA